MRAFAAVTDKEWYEFLAGRPDLDEVNFWRPDGNREFRALRRGEPRLFKLHYPENAIVGGGFLAHSFDRGYLTVTRDHHVRVSPKLKADFDNGEHYYRLEDSVLWVPRSAEARPSGDLLEWHADTGFRG